MSGIHVRVCSYGPAPHCCLLHCCLLRGKNCVSKSVTEFDIENLLKGRKSRTAPRSAAKADVSDDADDLIKTEFDDEDMNVAVTKEDDDDDDMDFDEDDVDVDDTDGPGIIQDDITDSDELLPNLDNKDDQ